MRTVKSMREELAKFPDDARCFGDNDMLVVEVEGRSGQGVIYCTEDRTPGERETELLPIAAPPAPAPW